jgi:predicted GIY-YIG superfamily endonuclease
MTTPRNYTFYKFVCINNDINSCYVGSTANIKKRRTTHKSDCHNENSKNYNLKIYQTIRENGGWGNWKIVELGTKDNITKREAEQIEEEYRVQLKADMNGQRAFTTEEQMKEDYKEYKKQYYEDNKEKIAEYWNEYYQDNKEKLNKKMKEYREANKEKIKEQQNEKHDCPCGGRYIHVHKSRHYKTKMHCDFINSQQ